MARPTKSAKLLTDKSQTKEEIKKRIEFENILKGESSEITPPSYLSDKQVQIFNYIVQELKNADILGNLDVFILSTCVIAIDRLQEIEEMINNDKELLKDSKIISAKKQYSSELFRCANELSLSPQARAKMSNVNMMKLQENEDPLLKILNM